MRPEEGEHADVALQVNRPEQNPPTSVERRHIIGREAQRMLAGSWSTGFGDGGFVALDAAHLHDDRKVAAIEHAIRNLEIDLIDSGRRGAPGVAGSDLRATEL